jgi:hypothetical protein
VISSLPLLPLADAWTYTGAARSSTHHDVLTSKHLGLLYSDMSTQLFFPSYFSDFLISSCCSFLSTSGGELLPTDTPDFCLYSAKQLQARNAERTQQPSTAISRVMINQGGPKLHFHPNRGGGLCVCVGSLPHNIDLNANPYTS